MKQAKRAQPIIDADDRADRVLVRVGTGVKVRDAERLGQQQNCAGGHRDPAPPNRVRSVELRLHHSLGAIAVHGNRLDLMSLPRQSRRVKRPCFTRPTSIARVACSVQTGSVTLHFFSAAGAA
jgi:hypothetical protein